MLTILNTRFVQAFPGGGQDFLDRWTGASKWVVEGLSPYHPNVTALAQQMIYGRPARPEEGEDLHHFVYPFHSMIFFAPFGFLDFPQARALWMTLLELSIVGLVIVSLRLLKWEISRVKTILFILFSFSWVYGAHTLLVGQFAGLNALLIALVLLTLQRNQDIRAGILLALTTTKPQMVVLLIPFLILWALTTKRWRLISSFGITLGILLVASLIILPTWPLEMWGQLSAYPIYAVSISPVEMIGVFFPVLAGWGTTLATGLIVLTLAWSWWQSRTKTGRVIIWAALLSIVVTNLIIPRTTTSNFMMMLPAFFLGLMSLEQSIPRWGSWLIAFVFVGLFISGWMLFFAAFIEETLPKHLVFFPLPILCFIGLIWAYPRWVRPTQEK
ncbi:MAG TPA: glycosyltransferase family 87 protein [Anaerolineales bacterium]|nr:glycosyltransferase family 87 protein [Anaerolineales bacterium]